MINITEKFSKSKTGNESSNEDGIFISNKYLAVIDGATSKTSELFNGLTGGQVVRNIIMSYLNESCGKKTFKDTVLEIQNKIETEFSAKRYFPASASAVIYNIFQNEIWMIGDCQAMINGREISNKKKVDTILSEARSMAINALLSQGWSEKDFMENDKGRELILPFLKIQHEFENTAGPYGFLVFNNQFMDTQILEEQGIIIPIKNPSTIILASDGYPHLADSLSESEKRLSSLLTNDPLCYKDNKSTKGIKQGFSSFDDRSFLKFSIC